MRPHDLFPIQSSVIGLCLDMSDRAAFLYTAFDSMFSAKFCGSKAADFCGSTSNGLCFLMSAKDVTETLTGYDQIFRRVMKKLQAGASPVQSILFLVKSDSGSAEPDTLITNEIKTRMSEIWSDYDGQVRRRDLNYCAPEVGGELHPPLSNLKHFRHTDLKLLHLLN